MQFPPFHINMPIDIAMAPVLFMQPFLLYKYSANDDLTESSMLAARAMIFQELEGFNS